MKRCIKHPDYDGKKQPTYKKECVGCLQLYLDMITPRAPIKPTKVEKDKSKYDRKNKEWLDE